MHGPFRSGLWAAAAADTDAADELGRIAFLAKTLERLEASQVVERLARILDRPGGTGRGAGAADAAVAGERRVRFERHVREHRDQPEARPELGVDEEVVAPEPS